ncbi:hypothetical protein F4861DRAFT_144237 [Xylaria intraflava]|nr:hypothetical protein F4861DRAFT_144237 [Xylaria intraflava]
MGLFNFLSKKSHSDPKSDLKTSGYDTTVASSPPIRGTYPVPGNGARILEEFQKVHPGLTTVSSASRLRTRSHVAHDSDIERPRTAPSHQPRKTESISTPPSLPTSTLPKIPKKKYGPYKLPPRILTDIPTSSISAKSAPLFALASPYSASIRSNDSNKTKGYVDLLDAQSKFKPYDFYGRVQATGARDYGEDVAERNRGDTKSLATTNVQESHSNPIDEEPSFVASKDVGDIDDEPPRRPRIRHSMGSGLRSKYTSYTPESFPKRTSSLFPPRDADDISKAIDWATSEVAKTMARRTSTRSFSTPLSNEAPQEPSAERQGEAKESDHLPTTPKDETQAGTAHEREHVKPNMSTKRQPLVTVDTERQSRQKFSNLDKPLPALPPSAKDSPKRRTTSHGSVRSRSVHTIRSGSRGEATQSPRNRNSARYQPGSTTDLPGSFYNSPAQQRIATFRATGADEKDESNISAYSRKRSTISLSGKSITAREIEQYIPERASSLRHSSLTSDTAMSTRSSALFRPQSSHSTSTSVDFTPMFPHAYSDPSIPPVPNIPFLMSSPIAKKSPTISSQSRSHRATHRRQPSEFFLDDYASSDDNNSAPPSRGSYEKELLFLDTGYGESGPQLSGLPGLFDIAVSTSDADLPNQARQNGARGGAGLLRMPAYFEVESSHTFEKRDEPDTYDADLSFDIPTRRHNRGREPFLTNR